MATAPQTRTTAARTMPGMARFHGNGMGGGAAASSSTRSMTRARKPEVGISSSFWARMVSSWSCLMSCLVSTGKVRGGDAAGFVFEVGEAAAQQIAGAGEAGLDGSLGQAKRACGGGHVHFMKVEEQDRLAVAERQGEDGAANGFVAGAKGKIVVLNGRVGRLGRFVHGDVDYRNTF